MRAELFVLPEVGQIHLNPADAVQQSLVHDGSGHRYHCQPGQTHMYVVRKQPQHDSGTFLLVGDAESTGVAVCQHRLRPSGRKANF